ncbi:hypothetical protein D7Z54_31895 [Salibacterium salarium]|uniref:Uncharacterized protein n=1 Tax=Salibacterium salarium TaxID=284579 RepID=A0A428MT60_9BACI|nr:hypothetical protein [Salibacterium salarium]RSL29307.1 hypothetical protein D7Z54_31895 [Salibacterium salarium]
MSRVSRNRKPHGYWKTEKNVIEALSPIIKKLGYIPSLREIKRHNPPLGRAINRYYNMAIIYKWFGRENEYSPRKPVGYWQDEQNVFNTLIAIIEQEKCIPSARRLIELGYHDLVSAISRYYKITEIRRWFNFEGENQINRSYLKDKKNIYDEIYQLINKLRRVPVIKDFKDNNKSYVLAYIYCYHKTTYNKILHDISIEPKNKENGYWKKKVNIYNTFFKIIIEKGFLPSSRELRNNTEYCTFAYAINKYHGGFHSFRSELGLPQFKKEKGYWQNDQNALEELKPVIDQYGYIPKLLRNLGLGDLEGGLLNFGGVFAFAQKHNLPLENKCIPSTFFNDKKKLDTHIFELIKKLGGFPSSKELTYLGEYAVKYRLCKMYGSIAAAKKEYGFMDTTIVANDGHACDSFAEKIVDDFLDSYEIPHTRNVKNFLSNGVVAVPDFMITNTVIIEVLMCDYRDNLKGNKTYLNYTKRYLLKREAYLEKQFEIIEIFPDDLKNFNSLYKKLLPLIKKYKKTHIDKVSVNIPLTRYERRPPGYWQSFENVEQELRPICEDLSRMPTRKELSERGLNSVIRGVVRYHHSFKDVAKKMEVTHHRKPHGYWKHFSNIKYELIPICRELRRMPTNKELLERNLSTIGVVARKYHGGLYQLAQKIGYPHKSEHLEDQKHK